MKTTKDFLNAADEAMNDYIIAKDVLTDFTLKSTKSAKQLKKDAEFLKLASKMTRAKQLWYDLNTAALIQAKQEKIQSILN